MLELPRQREQNLAWADRKTHVKALFLCPVLDAGGAERHWATLLPALRERGAEVRLVAVEGGGRALEELREAGVPVRELGAAGLSSLKRLPALLTEVSQAPNVIVTFGYNAHALGALFARVTTTPQLLNWHRQQGWPMTRVESGAVRFAARLGAGAIAVTQAQLPDLERLGLPADRLRVAPNGVEAPRRLGDPRAQIRTELGLPADGFLAVLVARLRPEKRITDFIDAVARLRSRVPGLHAVVVGDGPLAADLRAYGERQGAPMRFAGFQSEPTDWMLAADAVCLTSEFEALPMALIEATSCGRACVATNVGGNDEIVQHGINGFLVAPADVSGLAAALERLAREDALRQRMEAASLSRWGALFSFDAMADRYLDLLGSVHGVPASWERSTAAAVSSR
jgi:glycosyltransferase involved in cell wall biosynthesis